jgi:hypothetical protein
MHKLVSRSFLWMLTLSLLTASGCGIFLDHEVYLIPSGFRGDVFLVLGIGAGVPPVRREGASVFVVPANGILVTQDRLSSRWVRSTFYSVEADGQRQRLEEVPSSVPDTPGNRANRRPIVWFQRTVTLQDKNLPCVVRYAQFYVGSRSHLLARDSEADERRFLDFVRTGRACNR